MATNVTQAFNGSFRLTNSVSYEPSYSIFDDDAVFYPSATRTLMCIFGFLYAAVGGIGNAATVIALSRNRKLRHNAMTKFVIFLAVSDLQFCVLALPLNSTRYVYRKWMLGSTACKVFPFIFYTNIATSFLMTLAITVNRYIIIVHQAVYDKIYSRWKIAVMVLFAYLFPALLLLPTLVGAWGQFGYKERIFSCTFMSKNGRSSQMTLFIVGLCVPTVVIVGCYLHLMWIVRKNNKEMQEAIQGASCRTQHEKMHRQEERQLTKTVITVITSFLICNAPVVIVSQSVPDNYLPTLHAVVAILTWTNFIANPFIYAFKNKNYRSAYIGLLCCSAARNKLRTESDRLKATANKTLNSRSIEVP